MRENDIKYVIDIDIKYPTIYKAKLIRPHSSWENNWLIKYMDVVLDFLNMPGQTLYSQEGIYDATHMFDTVEDAITATVSGRYGMPKQKMVEKLFK